MLTLIMYLYFDNVSVHWQLVCTKYKSATVGGGKATKSKQSKLASGLRRMHFKSKRKKKNVFL